MDESLSGSVAEAADKSRNNFVGTVSTKAEHGSHVCLLIQLDATPRDLMHLRQGHKVRVSVSPLAEAIGDTTDGGSKDV